MTSAQRIQYATKSKQIAARVDRLTTHLLRRRVVRRAGVKAAASQTGIIYCTGQTKIGQECSIHSFVKQDVRRFKVAMNQSFDSRPITTTSPSPKSIHWAASNDHDANGAFRKGVFRARRIGQNRLHHNLASVIDIAPLIGLTGNACQTSLAVRAFGHLKLFRKLADTADYTTASDINVADR